VKIEISNISTQYLGEFTLTKEVDNNFIVDKIDSKVLYQDADHKYLVERAVTGDDSDFGTIEEECGVLTFTKNVHVKHNEGDFDLIKCETNKTIIFDNVLDCIANKTINIFDYTRVDTNTIQGGEIERETVNFNVDVYFDQLNYTIDNVLTSISVEDRSNEGFYIESGVLSVGVRILETQFEDEYVTHEVVGYVNYVRMKSVTKLSDDWILIPGEAEYYYSKINNAVFSVNGSYTVFLPAGTYYEKDYAAGTDNLYQDIAISNTIPLNEILEAVFDCTGKTLISNFFGINSDATSPDNSYYEWATSNAQYVKIAQSYDIIKEDAEQDSFGISGDIKGKDLLSNLFKVFKLIATVDGANVRIEHVSYYYDKGIDLTGTEYELSPLEINKDSINSEVFSFAQETPTRGFYNSIITYETNNIYQEENEVNIQSNLFITDVFGLINNPKFEGGSFEKLFFLLSTDGTDIIGLNKPFSMEEIVKNLHTLQRPMKVGYINGDRFDFFSYSVGFTGELKFMSNLINWDNLRPLMNVKIGEGTFLIESLEINQNEEMTLKIKK